jgi:RNA polymerase sigma-70 factor (sigma-E family)
VPRREVPPDANTAGPDLNALAPYTSSFEDFVAAKGGSLLRTAFLLCGDRQHAEDLVQTALARSAPRYDELVTRGDPTAYVRRVVVRSVIGWRRRRWHGERPAAIVPDVAVALPDPADRLGQREQLRRALMTLPARQRAAVVLRFYEDLSERDAAAVLGCSVGTVKSQTAKGLAKLRAALDPDGAERRRPDAERDAP